MREAARRNQGFTFIEVVIAMVIISGVLLAFTSVMTAGTRQARAGGAGTQAPLLAEHIVETFRAELRTSGTATSCGASTHEHVRDAVTYQERRLVTPLAVDEASATLVEVPCDAPRIDAYRVESALTWTIEQGDHQLQHAETVSAAEHIAPRIDVFSAGATLITAPGDPSANETTLAWDVPVGGQPLEVRISSNRGHELTGLPYRGSATVHVDRSTTFTITASNPAGSDNAQIHVYALDVAIDDLTSNRLIVGPDEPFTLSWTFDAPIDPTYHRVHLSVVDSDVTGRSTYDVAGIASDTSYALSVHTRHASGMLIDQQTHTVQYGDTPVIHDADLDPPVQCEPGGPVTLSWNVSAARNVYLDAGAGATLVDDQAPGVASAQVAAASPGSHAWTLIFENLVGTRSGTTLPVTTTPLPEVTKHQLTPNPVVEGAEVTHAWAIAPATLVRMNGTAVGANESRTFRAFASTESRYELYAENAGCEAAPRFDVATLTVEDIDFASVDASPEHPVPAPNENLTVDWPFTNTFDPAYHQVVVRDQDGTVHYRGGGLSATFPLPDARTYELTVTLETTEATPTVLDQVTVPSIVVRHLPQIDSVSLPATVCAPSGIPVTWATTHATSVAIEGQSVTPVAGGSHTIPAPHGSAPRSVEVVATNDGGRSVQEAHAVALQAPPRVDSFNAMPNPVTAGDTLTLSWATSHAQRVLLDGSAVAADGSLSYIVTGPVDHTLTAEPIAPCGTNATSSITPSTLGVSVPTPHLTVTPTTILAGASASLAARVDGFDPSLHVAELLAPIGTNVGAGPTSTTVAPSATRTYELAVTAKANGALIARATTGLTVLDPAITVLTAASPNPAHNGQDHTLRYGLDNFDPTVHTATLRADYGASTTLAAASGQWTAPGSDRRSSDVTYTLTITRDSDGSELDRRSYSFSVRAAPDASFYRSPSGTTASGSRVRVYYDHNGNWSNAFHRTAISATSYSTEAPTSDAGSYNYYPSRDTTFRLRIYRRSDNALLRSRSFRHYVADPPSITELAASPDMICGASGTTTLSWRTRDATSVRIYNSRTGSWTPVSADGSRAFTVASNGYVQLRATGPGGTRYRILHFDRGTQPTVDAFRGPATVSPGETFLIGHLTSNASSVRVDGAWAPIDGRTSHSIANTGTRTYTLTATSSDGCTASDTWTVEATGTYLQVKFASDRSDNPYDLSWFGYRGTRITSDAEFTITDVPQNQANIQVTVRGDTTMNASPSYFDYNSDGLRLSFDRDALGPCSGAVTISRGERVAGDELNGCGVLVDGMSTSDDGKSCRRYYFSRTYYPIRWLEYTGSSLIFTVDTLRKSASIGSCRRDDAYLNWSLEFFIR